MNFETKVYIDEYVIDGRNNGVFIGDDTSITYNPENPDISSAVSIPTDDIDEILFRRDTTLLRTRFLGWFFAVVTLVLFLITADLTAAILHAGFVNRGMTLLTLFLFLLVLGGISTTYEYFNGEEYDIVAIIIKTDDGESHIFTQRVKNTNFVQACGELIESDLETRNQNKKLDAELSD